MIHFPWICSIQGETDFVPRGGRTMRNLVTVLVAGLVLASCEPPSEGGTAGAEPSLRTTHQVVTRSAGCYGFGPNPPQIAITSPIPGSALSGTVTLTRRRDGRRWASRGSASPSTAACSSRNHASIRAGLGQRHPRQRPGGVHRLGHGQPTATRRRAAPVEVTFENTGNATYDATRAAPACAAVGNRCDSADLLAGRGGFGPEPHSAQHRGRLVRGWDGTARGRRTAPRWSGSSSPGAMAPRSPRARR